MESLEKTIKYYLNKPLTEETLNEIVNKFDSITETINPNDSRKLFWSKDRKTVTLSGIYKNAPEIINYSLEKNYLEFFRGNHARHKITEILDNKKIPYKTSKL